MVEPDEKTPYYELATVIDPPYVMPRADGSGQLEGLVVDLLDTLARRANFQFSQLRVVNGTYGHQQPNNSWTGLIGRVTSIPADMAVGAIAMSAGRESVLQFTEPFHSSSVQLLIPRPAPREGPGAAILFAPFTSAAWFLIMATFILVSVGLFLIGRFSPHESAREPSEEMRKTQQHRLGLENSILFAFSTFLLQGYREAPRSMSGRVLAVAWFAFSALILISYASNLTALLSLRPHLTPSLSFRNYEDILRDRVIDIGMIHNGDADIELSSSMSNLEKQLYEYVSNRHKWVNSLEEGLQRMRNSDGKFILLLPTYKARHLAAHNCDLITYGHGLGMVEYAFGFPEGKHGEKLRRRINSAILTMKQTGALEELHRKWDGKGGNCPDPEGAALPVRRDTGGGTFAALGPRDLAVAFLAIFLLGLLAAGLAVFEYASAPVKQRTPKSDEESPTAAEPLNNLAGSSTPDAAVEVELEEKQEIKSKSGEVVEPEDKVVA